MNTTIIEQVAKRVTPLTLNLEAHYDDLRPLMERVRDAKIVGLGSAVRHSHELLTLSHRVLRFLMEEHGFRALALEGDEAISLELDAYIRSGEGDPRAILTRARPFWRFAEILDAICWIRKRNAQNPNDQIRIVHVSDVPREATQQLAKSDDIERRLAGINISWHEQTGQQIVHWGGLAHVANGLANRRTAGSHLRAHYGSEFVSIALTFHHGALPSPVDAPPDDFVEAMLGSVELESFLLDLHDSWSAPVIDWLDSPAKMRLIGPGVHELHSLSLRSWFDVILYARVVTPAHPL